MIKRNFTGPFWLLLSFGVFLSLVVSIYLRILQLQMSGHGRPEISVWWVLRFFVWPGVMLVEAVAYWLLRRRNSYRALSWTHAVIFVLSFVFFIGFAVLTVMHYSGFSMGGGGKGFRPVYLFWALVVVAHLAFVAVLVNCFRRVEPGTAVVGEQENLLDDVVL